MRKFIDSDKTIFFDSKINDSDFKYSNFVRSGKNNKVSCEKNVKIALAGKEYIVEEGHIDWSGFLADYEDYSLLHRFSWLNNHPCFFYSAQLGHDLIHNWIDTFHGDKRDEAYQSYNIAERLINWMLFLIRWREYTDDDIKYKTKIFVSIKKQLYILANNLEQGGEYTNNHLFNDGRALYIVGWFVNDSNLVSLGRKCIRFGYEKLVSENGFLKEHSTHYHLLISKNFFEIYLLAVENDLLFKKELQPILKKLIFSSLLFLGQTSDSAIPLIGDISPDVSPQWLSDFFSIFVGFSESGEREGGISDINWSDVWDVSSVDLAPFVYSEKYISNCIDRESGFCCLRSGALRFYFHNPISDEKPRFSHYHTDDLSFSLMFEDVEIIQDPGRPTYINTHRLSQYAKSSFSHNTVFFNKMPISPSYFKLFPPEYLYPGVKVGFSEENGMSKLQVFHDGFSRIHKKICFQREFALDDLSVTICDIWALPVSEGIVTRFHFGRKIDRIVRGENCLHLWGDNNKITVKMNYGIDGLEKIKISRGVLGSDETSSVGWCFPRYGVAVETFTVDFIQNAHKGSFINKFMLVF